MYRNTGTYTASQHLAGVYGPLFGSRVLCSSWTHLRMRRHALMSKHISTRRVIQRTIRMRRIERAHVQKPLDSALALATGRRFRLRLH